MAGKANDKAKNSELRNVRVKVLRKHSNQHGKPFAKEQGKFYIHPHPEADIAAGLVEVASEKDAEKPTPKASDKK